MTVLKERLVQATGTKDPRELIGLELFDRLARFVAEHQSVTMPYAERVIEQTLVWLAAVADNPGVRLAMSETVDPGWHAFILHSRDYTRFCDRILGRYLHHVPPGPGASTEEATIARTLPALYATGYPVDDAHWSGHHSPCCPPNPCMVAGAEHGV